MPPSGWYDDPEQPWTWRYWDGATWTDHRAPMWVAPARDPRSFSTWFDRSVAAAKPAFRRVGVLLLAVWVVFGVAGWLLVVSVFDGDRGRELRRLLDIEQNTFGGTTVTAELTDAEAERAWELVQDIFWSALPWMIFGGLIFVVLSAWSLAVAVRAVETSRADGSDAAVAADPIESLASIAGAAVRRAPAVIGSGIVVFAAFAAVWTIAWLPLVVVAVAGGEAAAIVLTVLFVVLLLAVATAWLWVRLSLAAVIAAAGGHGIGLTRSWALTNGSFWYAAGRVLITALIVGVANGVINSATGFAEFLGFGTYLAIVFLLQAVTMAAASIITAAGHLVAIDQLADRP